jgi:hypothetical protein
MTDLTSLVQGLVSQLGRAFFISGYGPVLIGVAANMYLLFSPSVTGGGPFNLFPQITEPLLGVLDGQLLTLLLVPILLGLIVVALNTVIIKFFEGMLPGMKVLLYPLYHANVQRHKALYGELLAKREERRQLLLGSSAPDQQADYELRHSIQEEHEKAEAEELVQSLPRDPHRITPTAFGNAWAVIEDYPWERYGMDSVLFWPRLRSIVATKDESIIGLLDNQKVVLDMLINLELVMLVLAIEGVGVAVGYGRLDVLLLAAVALLLGWAFYRSAVVGVGTMSTLITQCFDFYRGDLLAAYGLERPATLQEERTIWLRLAAFLRRGEPFYFDSLSRSQPDENSPSA